jgi:hypothetical protein
MTPARPSPSRTAPKVSPRVRLANSQSRSFPKPAELGPAVVLSAIAVVVAFGAWLRVEMKMGAMDAKIVDLSCRFEGFESLQASIRVGKVPLPDCNPEPAIVWVVDEDAETDGD